jgi:ABC-type Zn uptake system ZnuABC Zn-binding protein ZnuA
MNARLITFLPALMLAAQLSIPDAVPAAGVNKAKTIEVAATIFPIADIARRIAGPGIRVIQILPAGASPHTFDLTPSQVRKMQKSRLIFKIGGIDDWVDGISESLPQAKIVTLQNNIVLKPAHEKGHSHHGKEKSGHQDFDPHYWLDAANGMLMARNIADTLSAADPSRAAVYDANYRQYSRELTALHGEIKTEFSKLKNIRMIVFHDAWRYFAAAYGLEITAVFQPSPGREPSPRDMQELYAQVRLHGIKTVFSEPQLPTASIEPVLRDLNLKLVVLDPLGGTIPGDSYIRMLHRNARAIVEALRR